MDKSQLRSLLDSRTLDPFLHNLLGTFYRSHSMTVRLVTLSQDLTFNGFDSPQFSIELFNVLLNEHDLAFIAIKEKLVHDGLSDTTVTLLDISGFNYKTDI